MKINDRYDVVVVGSGGAGLTAALSAREQGASVLLLSKAPAAKNCCTAYAMGGFSFAGPGTPWQTVYDRTKTAGRKINDPALLEAFCREGGLAVLNLQRFGMRMTVHAHGARVGRWGPNPTMGGMGMTLPLLAEARRMGVDVLDGQVVTAIGTQAGRVTGVTAMDLATGEEHAFSAAAVIMATGGAGRVFGRTDNPMPVTGDGISLLYGLGLSFRDMEFVQFYPMSFAEPGLPVWFLSLLAADDAPLTDAEGREFFKEHLREWGLSSALEANSLARDRCAIAIAQVWANGGEVLLHTETLSPQQWEKPVFKDALTRNRAAHDITKKPVRIRPLAHYCCGGVVINEQARTELDGLFACGEVTGGVDGANRVAGNALTNAVLFGERAGKNAALYALGHPVRTACQPNEQPRFSPGGEEDAGALQRELRGLMDEHAGPLRSRKGLDSALEGIAAIAEKAGRVRSQCVQERKCALELRGMLAAANLIASAALRREESRGVHYRMDFPEELENWEKPIIIKKDE